MPYVNHNDSQTWVTQLNVLKKITPLGFEVWTYRQDRFNDQCVTTFETKAVQFIDKNRIFGQNQLRFQVDIGLYSLLYRPMSYSLLTSSSSSKHNNNASHLYCTQKLKQTHRRGSHCTSEKRMNSILRHVAELFPPARQGTILSSHRVIGIATNTSMVLNCALVTYVMKTADVGLPVVV